MTAVATSRGTRDGRLIGTFLIVAFVVAISRGIARADFNYANFSSVAGLTLNGSAAQNTNNLRLTPNQDSQSGTAWRTLAKAHLAAGFDTTFTFQMSGDVNESGGADGMAFVIQDFGPAALGGGGSSLGYESIPRSLAVELDTFGFNAETNNHISIQTRGATLNSTSDLYSLGLTNPVADLNDGALHTLRIRYRPGFMLVFLDAIPAPVLNISIDLQDIDGDNILDGSGDAWVGFSAATGGGFQTHDVTSWNFDETSDALPSGACCTLSGCIESNARNCMTNSVGHYAGDGTNCNGADCTGACCYIEGCFWPATVENCASEPGTFMGVGTECTAIDCNGACCDQLGVCTLVSWEQCQSPINGTFHGAGSSCTPSPCPITSQGACCLDLECSTTIQAGCEGNWFGQGSDCSFVNCFGATDPLGACCQSNQTCVDGVSHDVCRYHSGFYNDDDSLCANANCTAACDCLTATPLSGTAFFNDSTTGASPCAMIECDSLTGSSPAKIYALTLAGGGQCLINTCNGNDFDTVISVHSSCPMTPENLVVCDNDSCIPGSQVYFCTTAGQTYYVRVGGVNGASGNYTLFVYDYGSRILEGPFQNPANGHWYYLTATGTWTQNEQLALTKGGHVVTINNAAENEWVRSTFTPINNSGLLFGLNDAASEGTFVWPNGEPVGYTNWEVDQPDNGGGGGDEDYGFMKTDGKWLDQINCPANNSGEAVLEVNTLTLPGIVAGPIFNPTTCHNYYFTQPGTWMETELKAQSLGGHLVTINNAAENEFVRATFANFEGNGQAVWIGLRDTVTEGTFFWADGTPLSYTNWNEGEPNDFGNEDYVSITDSNTGTWNDSQGGGPLAGVIELSGSCNAGDMNCNGTVTLTDIPIFVAVLLGNPGSPGCPITNADMNGDTLINGRDIKPFVTRLLTP